ncbi:MAG: N-6 DNA methylase [Selenomonas sp.]|nr:N-6 DNA methylase [Selenomonas sp.]
MSLVILVHMSLIMYRLRQNGRAAVVLPDGFLFGTDNTKTAIKKKLLEEFNLHTVIRLPGSVFAPIPASPPICCSLTTRSRRKKRDSIVWICRRATSIFPRPSR